MDPRRSVFWWSLLSDHENFETELNWEIKELAEPYRLKLFSSPSKDDKFLKFIEVHKLNKLISKFNSGRVRIYYIISNSQQEIQTASKCMTLVILGYPRSNIPK